jgi:hypothetical protein
LRLSLKARSIQRTAIWSPGTVAEEFDLAKQYITGVTHAGQTYFLLNNFAFTSSATFAEELAALQTPGVKSTPRADGRGVDCKFNPIPTNEGTYDTKLLVSGAPWSHPTTKARLAALFPALNVCQSAGAGAATFTIKQNDAVAAGNRAHERGHAQDDEDTFKEILVPWDKALTDKEAAGQSMAGTSDADCESKLYNASRIDQPPVMLKKLIDSINAKARTLHGTPTGASLTLFNVQGDPNCTAVDAEVR